MDFEIIPGTGIGPVKLGMSREEVIEALGERNHSDSSDTAENFYNYAFQIEFTNDKASFIGVSNDPAYTITYKDLNVFDIESKELFNLISSHESKDHENTDSEYIFPEQIISLWDADEQYDRLGNEQRKIWAQVGLGSPVYLEEINRITNKGSG